MKKPFVPPTLEQYKDIFSLMSMENLQNTGRLLGMPQGNLMFRDWTDKLAEEMYPSFIKILEIYSPQK